MGEIICNQYFPPSWTFSANCKLPYVCLQRYLVSWCDTTTYRHCYTLNSTNVTGTETQFKKKLFAGDTYKFYVQAITAYGGGKESSIQVSVPALNLKVSYVSGYTTGRYGLQIYLYWRRWSIPYGQVVVSMYASCFSLPCSPQRLGGGGGGVVEGLASSRQIYRENRGSSKQTSGGREGTYEFWMACAIWSQCQTKS